MKEAQNTSFSNAGTAKPLTTQKRCLRRLLAGIILRAFIATFGRFALLSDDASYIAATLKRLLNIKTLKIFNGSTRIEISYLDKPMRR